MKLINSFVLSMLVLSTEAIKKKHSNQELLYFNNGIIGDDLIATASNDDMYAFSEALNSGSSIA